MTGTGDRCQLRTVLGSSGRVLAAAADPLAAAATDASVVVTHAAAAHGIHVACSDSSCGPTTTAYALDWSAYYHYDNSNSTT